MNNYLNSLDKITREYFKILSNEFPNWLIDYINTPEVLRLKGIGVVCGTEYSPIFNYKSTNNTLNHSIAVALIIWHFTNDKKQTLAGLFHDIATPAFKHCIDFMNGDSLHQESTEERTKEIIMNSKSIMALLKRDNIDIDEVSDYHIYPIADNDTPRLSADRFEYTFSNGLFLYGSWNLDKIKYFYDNVTILKNEDGVKELGFTNMDICKEYMKIILPIFANYPSDKNRTVMQFIADIVKSMNFKGYLTIDDLYNLSEEEIISKIKSCDDSYIRDSFIKFQNEKEIYSSDTYINDKYCISVKSKVRYIVPLTTYKGNIYRINKVSKEIEDKLNKFLENKQSKYTGFNFEFKSY